MVPHTWASRWVLRQGAAGGGLAAIVVTWWLLIGVVVVQTTPAPVVLAEDVGHVYLPGLSWLPIPVERAAFDESQRGYRESDEAAIERAFTAYEWIWVSHHDAVRIVTVDSEAIHVEMLEGPHVGRQGWLRPRHLGP